MNPENPPAQPPAQADPAPAPPPPPHAPVVPEGPLILNSTPMRNATRIDVPIHHALLFTDDAGHVIQLASYPSRPRSWKYKMRYVVDISRRHSVLETEVPSQTRTARFAVTLEVSWGVTDPTAIIMNGLTEGLPIIRPRLLETARNIGHSYPAGEAVDYENHLNRVLGGQAPSYPEGVGVFHCSARVRPDDRFQRKINEIDDLGHQQTVDGMNNRWVDDIDSEWGLLKQRLRQNPEHIPEVLAELKQRADSGNVRDDERLRLLMSSGLVKDMADLETGMPIIQQPARFDPNDAMTPQQVTVERVAALTPPEEENDVTPAEIVEYEDGVKNWVAPPWQRGDS